MFPLLDPSAPNPLELFQIWLNLPAKSKMAAPHFTMLWSEAIPRLSAAGRSRPDDRGRLHRRADRAAGVEPLPPPPDSWAAEPDADLAIWTIRMAPGARWTLPAAAGAATRRMLYFFRGDSVRIAAAS